MWELKDIQKNRARLSEVGVLEDKLLKNRLRFRGVLQQTTEIRPTKSVPSKFCLRRANALLSSGAEKLAGSVGG